jgi:iron complex outermembrane receptor protein
MTISRNTLIAVIVSAQSLYAQTGSVKGTVFDSESKQTLSGASISIAGTTLGTTTVSDGTFIIENVPAGRVVISATYVGYNPFRTEVEVADGKSIETTIFLDPVAIPLLPVIVTATTAKERETPATFSNMNQLEIKNRYLTQDVPAVLAELPSIVTYSENGNDMGYTHLIMRGFDQRRIAVMVNGIPQNDPEDHDVYWIDVPDLLSYTQNVQVQRGAGSDFYGPGAIGGSVNFVTTPIDSKAGVAITTAYGFQRFGDLNRTILNTRKYDIALNSGLINQKYAFLGNFSTTSSSGYRDHSWINLTSYFVGAARFDNTMTTRIHVYGGPLQDGLAYNGIPKFYNDNVSLRRINYNFFEQNGTGDTVTYSTLRKDQENESFTQPHYEILNEWKISPTVKLYNTFFYIQGDGYFDYDGDWVWNDPHATNWFHQVVGYDTSFGSTNFNSMLLRGFVANKQWGWLPRVEISQGNGTLTIGGELRIHRSVHYGTIPFASVYPANYDPDFRFYQYNGQKEMASLYGHELLNLDEQITLMVDLQLAYNRYGFVNERFLGNSFSVPYFFANPRLGINYNFTQDLNAYASLSYTSREPTLRNLYPGEDAYFGTKPGFQGTIVGGQPMYDFTKPLAKPERLSDLELGTVLNGQNGKFSASFFWMEFKDELVNNGKLDIFGVPVTGNADRTRHLGIELTAQQKLNESFDASGNLTLSRNRLIHYQEYDENDQLVSFDGNPISGFPDFLANVRFAYHSNAGSLAIAGRHVGSFYTDNTKDDLKKVNAYTVFNLEGSYEIRQDASGLSLTIRGQVRNLFNKLYMASGQGIEFFPAAERNFTIAFTFAF